MTVHCLGSSFGILQDFQSLLLKPSLLIILRCENDAVRFGLVVLIQVGEGGEAIGGSLLGFPTSIHFCIYGKGRAPRMDHLALESDDVAGEDGELEVNAMEHEQDGVFRVNILGNGKIGTFQEPLGTPSSEEGLVVVQVGEFD